ncbi:MAG: hypothetical protein JW934_13315 [Anaerolineae bacterium]|nr:hypothetical protein [Anaerolineae bacterium]
MIEQARWETWTLIPAGAGWMFAVGIVEQGGRRRVRIAKGKMKMADAGELPITQQAKLNLKPADWNVLRDAIDRYIAQLQGDKPVEENRPSEDSIPSSPRTYRTPEQLAQDFAREQATAYTDLESG